MTPRTGSTPSTLPRDLTAGLVVFLVALPLCLGVAMASNAPLFAGLLAGIVGGVLVGPIERVAHQRERSGGRADGHCDLPDRIARVVSGVPPGRGHRGPDPDRVRIRPGRVPRCLFPKQCDQGPAGRDRRNPDPQTDPPPRGLPRWPDRRLGVPPAGPPETRSPNSFNWLGRSTLARPRLASFRSPYWYSGIAGNP